jgi:hypothetical protein
MNYCAYNHLTDEELRTLPFEGGVTAIVCKYHYKIELRLRIERLIEYGFDATFPKWDELPLVKEENSTTFD